MNKGRIYSAKQSELEALMNDVTLAILTCFNYLGDWSFSQNYTVDKVCD